LQALTSNSLPEPDMKLLLMSFFTALRFLTIFPIPFYAERDGEFFQSSVKFFTTVGLLIGLFCFFIALSLQDILPLPLLCCVLLIFLSVVSGFLHLDGLADTADGFFSSRPRQQILEIMHDSRTGAMGVIALILIILVKYASLISIGASNLPLAVLLMPLAGRGAIIIAMYILPYARKNSGLGKLFYADKDFLTPLVSFAVFLSCSIITGIPLLLLTVITVVVTTLLFSIWCKNKIGGATGDTLGAVCELTETTVAFVLAAALNV